MTLQYGFIKSRMTSAPVMKGKRLQNETQYHLHFRADVGGADWDVAVNVGTDDADDLLKYKLVFDFHHKLTATLAQAAAGASDLTGTNAEPALDFLRSDLLNETGAWRDSDVIDGSEDPQPVLGLKKLLSSAFQNQLDVYVFGRFYSEGNGVHDVHLNQGSLRKYLHHPGDDSNDHNDIWQDGAVIVDRGTSGWAAYFAAFTQQSVPTDDLGNPLPGGHSI